MVVLVNIYQIMKLYLSMFKEWMVTDGNVHRTNYLRCI